MYKTLRRGLALELAAFELLVALAAALSGAVMVRLSSSSLSSTDAAPHYTAPVPKDKILCPDFLG